MRSNISMNDKFLIKFPQRNAIEKISNNKFLECDMLDVSDKEKIELGRLNFKRELKIVL